MLPTDGRLRDCSAVRTPRALRLAAVACGVALSLLAAVPSAGAAPTAKKQATIATTPYTMPTSVPLATTTPPWGLPADARPYIAAAGLQVLGAEQLEVHYHAHIDVIDASAGGAGQKVTVPAGIGFVIQNDQATGITVLHTHDTSGVIHIESAKPKPYTLGQVFTEWGVSLSATQVGGLVADPTHEVQVYVNGQKFTGDPATIRLKKHLEIALWYGPTGATPTVPKSYKFPAGL
jgi:hypothetical protein